MGGSRLGAPKVSVCYLTPPVGTREEFRLPVPTLLRRHFCLPWIRYAPMSDSRKCDLTKIYRSSRFFAPSLIHLSSPCCSIRLPTDFSNASLRAWTLNSHSTTRSNSCAGRWSLSLKRRRRPLQKGCRVRGRIRRSIGGDARSCSMSRRRWLSGCIKWKSWLFNVDCMPFEGVAVRRSSYVCG